MASRTPVGRRTQGVSGTPESPIYVDEGTPMTHMDAIERAAPNQASTSPRSGAGGCVVATGTVDTMETLFDHVMSRQRAVRSLGGWQASSSRGFHHPGMPPYTRILKGFVCGPENGPGKGTILCDASRSTTSPVFVMKFSSGRVRYRNLVALGDEEGFVSIIRATDPIPGTLGDPSDQYRPVGQWRAHQNAIFDLEWANDDRWMYCASGDTKLSLWDTGYASRISTFHSGRASVKTLSVKADNHNVFASAGRDGDLYIHDVRVKETRSTMASTDSHVAVHRPVLKLDGPHSQMVSNTPSKAPKFGYARSGVTSLCFLKGPNSSVLASGGQDGRIKLWDLRYTADPASLVLNHRPLADQTEALSEALCAANEGRSIHNLASMRQPPLSQRVRGVTSLSLHPDGTRLLASYIGGQHLVFDVAHPEAGPLQWFGGNLIDSFYVKSAFSPDGTHIISGSSDSNAYIYSLKDKQGTNPIVLTGHASEVTTVAWNPYDQCQVMTAGDDHVAKFWRVDTGLTQEQESPQAYDPSAVLRERIEYEKAARTRRGGTTDRMSGGTIDRTTNQTPRMSEELAIEPSGRVPLRVKNVLLEGPETSETSHKRKAARQLTISDALKKVNNRRRNR